MPPRRELNERFKAYERRARRVRATGTGLLVVCLLIGAGVAFAKVAPQESTAQSAIKNVFASVADSFGGVSSAISHAAASISNNLSTSRAQTAAASSDDSISNRIYRFFCPWFTDCDEPAVEFTTNTTPTRVQPRSQPQQIQPTYTVASTTPQYTSTQRPANIGTGAPTTVVNNPVVERVIERVVQGAPASLAGYVTQADLMSQIAAVKQSVGTQLYGDWYNNPGSSSNNGGIVGTIGMMGRIDNLSGTNLSDITVDGVSGLTDADIPDGITATNYLALTGGAITGDLSLSGTLTAGALAVSGVSSGGAIEAPYFTATSTSASSTFPNLNATNATTTNATSTNLFSTLGRFTTAIVDAFSAVSATITNLTSTTLVATNATTTRLDAFDYVAVGRTATTTIRGDGVASTIPFASSTAVSVSGTGFFGTASTTNFNLSGTANLQSLAADSLLYNNSSRQLAAASVGSGLSFTGSSLSLNLGNGNTWTGLQQFYGAASSTLFSAHWAKFGATASSTFGTDGSLTMGGNIILNGKYLSGDGGNEGVYVDTSGNVGIGTTNPAQKLQVGATTDTSSNLARITTGSGTDANPILSLFRSGSSESFISYLNDGHNKIVFGNDSAGYTNSTLLAAAKLVINNSTGNVGIGTTSPWQKLSVYSTSGDNPTALIASTQNDYPSVRLKNASNDWSWILNGGTNQIILKNEAAGTWPIVVDSTAADQGFVLKSGNVGIGTTTPNAKLQVYGSSVDISTSAPLPANESIFRIVSSNTAALDFGSQSSSPFGMWLQSRNNTSGTQNYPILLNPNGGNVGIGTTSPQALLGLQGGIGVNSNQLYLAANGRIGIGTSNPSGTVSMYDTTPSIELFNTATGRASSLGLANGYLGLYTTGADDLILGTNGVNTNYIRMYNATGNIAMMSGNVGIGTTSPVSKLSVVGESAFAGGGVFGLGYAGTAAPSNGLLVQGNVGIGTTSPWRTLSVSGTAALNGLTAGAGAGSLCLTAGKEVVYSDNAGCTGSSLRFKHDIADLDALSGIDEALKLRPVSFVYNDDIGVKGTQVGFIAEDVAQVDQRLVTYDASSTPNNVKYTNMVAIAIKAIQEIWAKVLDLSQKVADLFRSDEAQNAEIEALKARVSELENRAGVQSSPPSQTSSPAQEEQQTQESSDESESSTDSETPAVSAQPTDTATPEPEPQTEAPSFESPAQEPTPEPPPAENSESPELPATE